MVIYTVLAKKIKKKKKLKKEKKTLNNFWGPCQVLNQSQNLKVASARNCRVWRQGRRGQGTDQKKAEQKKSRAKEEQSEGKKQCRA